MNDGKFYISHSNNTMQIFGIYIIKIGTESLMHMHSTQLHPEKSELS